MSEMFPTLREAVKAVLIEESWAENPDGTSLEHDGTIRLDDIVRAVLTALREPSEEMIASMSNTSGARNINTLLSWAAAHGHSLRWKENGDPPPLTQAFTAAIDFLLNEDHTHA